MCIWYIPFPQFIQWKSAAGLENLDCAILQYVYCVVAAHKTAGPGKINDQGCIFIDSDDVLVGWGHFAQSVTSILTHAAAAGMQHANTVDVIQFSK